MKYYGIQIISARQNDDQVHAVDQDGKRIASYDAIKLAMEWFQMTNDDFFNRYGFNWVPRGWYYEEARRRVSEKAEEDLRRATLGSPGPPIERWGA